MRLVSFQSSDGPKLGALVDDKVLDLQATYQAAVTDDALPALLSGMIAFLEAGQRGLTPPHMQSTWQLKIQRKRFGVQTHFCHPFPTRRSYCCSPGTMPRILRKVAKSR